MPLDMRGPHYAIQDAPSVNTATLTELGAAAVALHRALDCGSHILARETVGRASGRLEIAAMLCPERAQELLTLAGRLDGACDRIGWPDIGEVQTVLDEAEAIERALRTPGEMTIIGDITPLLGDRR